MKMLHTAYRVSDLERSVDFYGKVGFREIGRIEPDPGMVLVTLNLPEDGDVVTLELVSEPSAGPLQIGNGFSHIVVQVESLEATMSDLAEKGIRCGELLHPAGPGGPKTSFLTDPDGYRMELVEWPVGHPSGVTAADFEQA
jgi:lactoylglutathione lyase